MSTIELYPHVCTRQVCYSARCQASTSITFGYIVQRRLVEGPQPVKLCVPHIGVLALNWLQNNAQLWRVHGPVNLHDLCWLPDMLLAVQDVLALAILVWLVQATQDWWPAG